MTSPGKSTLLLDDDGGSRKRPARGCKKISVYGDLFSSSDEEPLQKKRTKVGDSSDESFDVSLEKQYELPKVQTKVRKAHVRKEPYMAAVKTQVAPKTQKRKQDTIRGTGSIKVENEDAEVPEKKFKAETRTFVKHENVMQNDTSNCQSVKAGDWKCDICFNVNFQWRDACFKCTSQKPSHFDNRNQNSRPLNPGSNFSKCPSTGQSSGDKGGSDWLCPNPKCGRNNFPWRRDCFRCRCEKPKETNFSQQTIKAESIVKEDKFRNNPNPGNQTSENDWYCSNYKCGRINFKWRQECYICQTPKPRERQEALSEVKQEFSCPPDSGKADNFNYMKLSCVKKEEPIDEENVMSTAKETAKNSTIKNTTVKKEFSPMAAVKKETLPKKSVKSKTSSAMATVKKETSCKAAVKKEKISKKTVKKEEVNNLSIPENIVFKSGIKPRNGDDKFTRECQLISKKSNVPYNIVSNVINLFNSEATVPFIVRYRSHMTGGLSAEIIRLLKQHHESAKKLLDKADKMKVKLESLGYLDASLSFAIDSCVNQQELDYLYEPYKVLKSSKLVKVIDLGLSTPADNILYGKGMVKLEEFTKKDLDLNEITDLIIYYVGEIMSKDSDLMDRVREMMKTERIFLNSKQKTAPPKKAADNAPKKNRPDDNYSNYYKFSTPHFYVKPHQILAINRGEAEHCLQVTLTIPDSFQNKINQFARKKWYFKGTKYERREFIFNKALEFMYSKRICPYVKRHIRSDLTKQGEKASLEVFSSNLKYLLLSQPVRNVTVCSVDPGFKNGCKIAILNPQQEVLKTDVLYLENPGHFVHRDCLFVRLINEFKVDLLVVGNGKGCRDVELKISHLIEKNWLDRSLKYVVASECGISVYSCSAEAAEEYPNISPNLISAISLAKRIQDPLCELVKVEPKHLGVGMYQHDINEKKLDSVLDDVVSECVSIVGVDINNAPLRLLKRVAGLAESKAKTIIETREKNGSFSNRDDLKSVKGIGPKTFQQCAGFIKIIPSTVMSATKKTNSTINYFDQTIIHPEDYPSAKKILVMNNLQPSQIGSQECIAKLRCFMENDNLNSLAMKLSIPVETVKLIMDALTTPLDYDIRSTFDRPLFRNKATTIDDLFLDSEVCGRVENVTHFGAFIDLGVECKGLIHITKLNGKDLHLGQIVKVKVNDIDKNKMRIGLSLVNVM